MHFFLLFQLRFYRENIPFVFVFFRDKNIFKKLKFPSRPSNSRVIPRQ